jgi:hypothetical protein
LHSWLVLIKAFRMAAVLHAEATEEIGVSETK